MQRDIKQTWFFQHPPEIVWEYLTTAELLSQWLMENDFQPVVGHKFKFTTYPKVKIGFDGIIFCEVLEVTPFKRLSYSWRGGPGKGKITLDSVVTWTLDPKHNGTQVILEQKGFKGLKNYLSYLIMNKGWETRIKQRISSLLKNHVNERI